MEAWVLSAATILKTVDEYIVFAVGFEFYSRVHVYIAFHLPFYHLICLGVVSMNCFKAVDNRHQRNF